jgi:16S rRNA (cytosine1402-N4)-methyltransferase
MNDNLIGGEQDAGFFGEYLPHQPVLYHEVLDVIKPTTCKDYLDGTLGAGGHAEGILNASAPEGRLLGLDLDKDAITIAKQRLAPFGDRITIHQAAYQEAPMVLEKIGWRKLDGILLDLGVSSMQIDRADRGFSFMKDSPLDMRFEQGTGKTAGDLVNALSVDELRDILWHFGEERYSKRIARAIIAARPIRTTLELAEAVQRAVPGYESQIHPATRTFQALRIATNHELEVLGSALPQLVECLKVDGIIVVISFHSLEDRIVKQFFKKESQDCICPPKQPICTCGHTASLKIITKKPIGPTDDEIESNPRARSAKLRAARKIT